MFLTGHGGQGHEPAGQVLATLSREFSNSEILTSRSRSEILKNIDLGILAIGAVPRKSEKLERGSLGEDIRIGDIRISDGNWVYADENGVIISEKELEMD